MWGYSDVLSWWEHKLNYLIPHLTHCSEAQGSLMSFLVHHKVEMVTFRFLSYVLEDKEDNTFINGEHGGQVGSSTGVVKYRVV